MSISKRRNGSFTVRIDVDRLTSGKRRKRTIGTYATKKEAERAEREALSAKDRGIDLAPQTVTVTTLVERYVADRETECAAKTLERYHEILERHVKPHIGSLLFPKLRPPHVAAWIAMLRKKGGVGDKPLAPKSVYHLGPVSP